MKLAECRARELAYRDEGRPEERGSARGVVLVTHQPKRLTTMADIPEPENTA
jgi:hypothetical protein